MPKINTSVITDKSITKEKLNDELQGKINNIGNLPSLHTNTKDTLVNSINELYNNTVNGKNLVADAIRQKGVSIEGVPSYQQLANAVNELYNRLYNDAVNGKNLVANTIRQKGVNVVDNPTYQDLANAVNELYNRLYNEAVNGKNLVADAIRQKGVSIEGVPSYQQLHDKILQIDGRKEILEKGVNVSLDCPMWLNRVDNAITDNSYSYDFSHMITPFVEANGRDNTTEKPHTFMRSVRGFLGKSLLKMAGNYDNGFVDSVLYSKSSNTVKVKSQIFTHCLISRGYTEYRKPIDCFYILDFNNKKIFVYEREQDIPYNDYTYISNQRGRTTTQIYPNYYITQYTYFWIEKLHLFYQHTTGDKRLVHQQSYTYPLFVNYDNEIFIGIGIEFENSDDNNDIRIHDIFFSPCRITIS